MANQKELLRMLIEKLQEAGIEYMICGSVGASFYGLVRATEDTDLVISTGREQLEKFLVLVGDGYYVSSGATVDAFEQIGMFNIIEIEHAWKADLIVKKNDDFSNSAFERRSKRPMLEGQVWVATVEDIILSKLWWGKEAQSQLQYRDSLRIASININNLDRGYMEKWAWKLGVGEQLKFLLTEAESSCSERDS